MVTNILLARALGKQQFGAWNYLFSFMTLFCLLADGGISGASRAWVAKAQYEGNIKSVLRCAVLMRLLVSLFAASLLAALAGILARAIERPDFLVPLRLASFFVLAQGGCDFLKAVFEGLHRNRFTFIVSITEQIGKVGFAFAMCYATAHIEILVSGFAAVSAVASAMGLVFLYHGFYKPVPMGDAEPVLRPMLRYAAPLFVVSLGASLCLEMGTLMLGYLAGDEQVAVFAPAKQLTMKAFHIGAILSAGTAPVFANLAAEQLPYLRSLMNRLLMIILAVFALLSLFFVVFARPIIAVLYGPQYQDGALCLRLMTPFMVAMGVSSLVQLIMDYRGRAVRRAINLSCSIILGLLLNYLLIPRYWAVGTALATSLSFLPYVILNWLEARSSLKQPQPGRAH